MVAPTYHVQHHVINIAQPQICCKMADHSNCPETLAPRLYLSCLGNRLDGIPVSAYALIVRACIQPSSCQRVEVGRAIGNSPVEDSTVLCLRVSSNGCYIKAKVENHWTVWTSRPTNTDTNRLQCLRITLTLTEIPNEIHGRAGIPWWLD